MKAALGATYRVQLRAELGFVEVAQRVGYLASLGVETLYCSPIAEAVPGSAHGYDGTDPTRLRAELGGAEGFETLASACERVGLSICVDLVPNHLSTWPGGPWWRAVLAEGPDSEYGELFDLDFPRATAGGGGIALPVLDRPLAEALRERLVTLAEGRDGVVVAVGSTLDLPIAAPGARLEDDVAEVLAAQHYRLVDWHDRADRTYRRFFDIDGLVGLRQEREAVFARTHSLVIDLARRGRIAALRVDHIDGLRDPAAYLARLGEATGLPVVVEKILTGDERLAPSWPIAGTTGYEVLGDIDGALVDPDGLAAFSAAGRRDGDRSVEETVRDAKALACAESFPGELERLADALGQPHAELVEVLVRLPRYRTYLRASDASAPALEPVAEVAEERALWRATGAGQGRDRVVEALLDPANEKALLDCQQLSGAVMAKGVEDTAWYRLSGPLAFCEVGGDPAQDHRDGVARLHARAKARALDGRAGLVPGTTHDTKRSGDVRARLLALCEHSEAFEAGLEGLVASGRERTGASAEMLSPREWRVLASLALSIVPLEREPDGALGERLAQALVKGAREAKVRTSWTAPDEGFEAALGEQARRVLANDAAVLREHFGELVATLQREGATLSLGAVLLRSTLPGIPDCYQGDESWNFSLVDPDNRRLVDVDRLEALRGELSDLGDPEPGCVARVRRRWRSGAVKLLVTVRCLEARQVAGEALSGLADHLRVEARGSHAQCTIAFVRRAHSGAAVLALAPRRASLLRGAGDDLPSGSSFGDTVLELPDGLPTRWRDVLGERQLEVADGQISVAEALGELPVGLFVASGAAAPASRARR